MGHGILAAWLGICAFCGEDDAVAQAARGVAAEGAGEIVVEGLVEPGDEAGGVEMVVAVRPKGGCG